MKPGNQLIFLGIKNFSMVLIPAEGFLLADKRIANDFASLFCYRRGFLDIQ